MAILDNIAGVGALERYFSTEGKMSDNVAALPVTSSKLHLYCIRLSDKLLILGNGGVKHTRTYNEDDDLKGYVMTLQKFDKLIKEGCRDGSITIIENHIDISKTLTYENDGKIFCRDGGIRTCGY